MSASTQGLPESAGKGIRRTRTTITSRAGSPRCRAAAPAVAVKDPVCGMSVDPHTAKHTATHAGRPYYFCSAGCRDKFIAAPGEIPGAGGRRGPSRSRRAPSTPAPCIPQIRQVGPGSCPICGMALEPELVTAETGPNPELVDMTRRFWIGLALTIPVFALEMGGHLTNLHMLARLAALQLGAARAGDAGRAVGGLAVLRARLGLAQDPQPQHVHADRHGHRRGVGLQHRRHPRCRACFPAAFRGMDGAVPVYFEAAAVITVLVLLGQVLELRAREQTGGAIRALLDLAPKRARRIAADGSDEEVRLDAVAVGDRLRVRPGEKRAGRRRARRRAQLGRRVDGDRRIDAGRQGGRREA